MREDLLRFIIQTVKSNYDNHKRPTNGALLAEQIRTKFGGDPYRQAGFDKLSDAIRAAADQGEIVRNTRVKHLEVFPVGVSMNSAPTLNLRSYYIRPDAWRAFGMQFAGQSVFFDTTENEFVTQKEPLGDGFLPVSTPRNDEYKAWIEEFGNEYAIKLPTDVLQSPNCLREFSDWIVKQDGPDASNWKKFRAAKVTDAIITWGETAKIDTTEFFNPATSSSERQSSDESCVTSGQTDESVKNAIIACVRDMSLAEIDSLAIPVRHILNHFRPRS